MAGVSASLLRHGGTSRAFSHSVGSASASSVVRKQTPPVPHQALVQKLRDQKISDRPPGDHGRHVDGKIWKGIEGHEPGLAVSISKDGKKEREKRRRQRKRNRGWDQERSVRFATVVAHPKSSAGKVLQAQHFGISSPEKSPRMSAPDSPTLIDEDETAGENL